jgi:hypothetical protein
MDWYGAGIAWGVETGRSRMRLNRTCIRNRPLIRREWRIGGGKNEWSSGMVFSGLERDILS